MSDQDAFERILAALYDAMLDESLWPATSALIDAACGMQGNALMIRAGPQDANRVSYVGLYYRGQRRADWEREYLSVYYPINESVPRIRRLPDSRVVPTAALYTAQELRTSPTYNEAFPRGQAQAGLSVRLDGPAGADISWYPLDPVAPGGWGSPQLALINALLPHIRQFVRIRHALVGAQARGASLTALLDNTRIGVIHLDQRGQIIEANDRARALLRAGDGVSDRDGVLSARVPAARARLARLVAAALPTSGAPAVSGSLLLRRAAARPPLVVHVKPVGGEPLAFGARRVAVLVLLSEPGARFRINPRVVAATLGLTLVESQIAAWLAEGRTVREIAAATGRTPGAVYWSLNQIYRKQGLTRQVDLVRLVLSLAAFP